MRKKQLTINKLALGNLKQRRKQYTILIIGIILAMVFSSSTLFFLYSSNETYHTNELNRLGKQHEIYTVFDDDESVYSNAIKDGKISDYGLAHVIGYGYMNGGDRALGTAIAWLDDKCKDISNQSFIEGSYPQNENEIAIEKTALLKMGLDSKIGDEISLSVDIQNGEDYSGTVEKTYKLVGIVSDKRYNLDLYGFNSIMIPAAFVAQGTQTELGGKEILSAYVMIPDSAEETYEYFFNQSKVGYCYVESYNAYWTDDFVSGITDSGKYIAVIALVLIFVSCVAIINAFNTNLKERKKQIGMLRAVGATKRQIIKIFGREAFIISLICTPISIAISYGIVRITISFMSEEAVMTNSISVLVVSAVVCIFVTMLSALIPLLHASRIAPMQAIRNIEINRKMRTKKIRSQKDFDVPSLLAKRNGKFYMGGRIAVSSILIATIIFSCLGFSYINCMKDKSFYSGLWDYRLENMSDRYVLDYINPNMEGMSEADKRDIETYPYFSKVISQKYINAVLEIDEVTDYFRCFYELNWWIDYLAEDSAENLQEFVNGFSRGKDILPVPVYSLDPNTVKTLENSLTAGKIDYDKLASGEEIILVAPQSAKYAEYVIKDRVISNGFYDGKSVPEDYSILFEGESPYSVGDKINLSVLENRDRFAEDGDTDKYERTDREVTIGAIVSPSKLNDELEWILSPNDFAFLTIHSGMSHFSENAKYQSVYMNVDPDIEMDDDIDKTISDFMEVYHDRYGGWFASAYFYNQDARETMNFLIVAMLSIVLIGFVICASIINNSLTASVREKKKEIGTLRAVGADIGVLVKSYIRQLLSMLGVGYGVGFSVFCVIYALIVIICNIKNEGYDFVFSPWETLAFCAVLFAICSINLWSKVKKEMKNSLVDNIREL